MPRLSFMPAPWRAVPAGPVVAAVAVGVAYAHHDGLPLRPVPAVLCLAAALAAHAGLSSGMSLLDPEGAPDPVGPEDARAAVIASVGACVAAVLFGLSAALMSQPLVFLMGALGAVLAAALVLPVLPVAYLGNGIGELALLALAGPVPVVAGYASQEGGLHPGILAASALAGLASMAVVLLSQRAFAETDAREGRLTLTVTAGPRVGRWLPWAASLLAHALLVMLVRAEEFPPAALAGLATIPATAYFLARAERDPARESRLRDVRALGWAVTVTLALVAGAMAWRRW